MRPWSAWQMIHCTDLSYVINTNRMDPSKEIFAFKLCDEFIQKNCNFLKSRGLIPLNKNEDDDEDQDYSAVSGIEW